jgi:hypothetical protein
MSPFLAVLALASKLAKPTFSKTSVVARPEDTLHYLSGSSIFPCYVVFDYLVYILIDGANLTCPFTLTGNDSGVDGNEDLIASGP